jgi:hypothetical protein
MSTHAQPSRTERIAAEAHRRAQALDRSYPPLQELQAIADPRARRLVISHRATLTALAATEISPAAIEGLLLDANDALNTYNAIESEDGDDGGGEGDASDCMAGCDRNLKDCIESWSEILLETDVDLFDGEAEDQANDGGGAVGSIDDNPVDVEQSDAGDTGAEQEDDPRSDDWFAAVNGPDRHDGRPLLTHLQPLHCRVPPASRHRLSRHGLTLPARRKATAALGRANRRLPERNLADCAAAGEARDPAARLTSPLQTASPSPWKR